MRNVGCLVVAVAVLLAFAGCASSGGGSDAPMMKCTGCQAEKAVGDLCCGKCSKCADCDAACRKDAKMDCKGGCKGVAAKDMCAKCGRCRKCCKCAK